MGRKMGVPEEIFLELGESAIAITLAIEKAWALPGGVYLHTDTHCPTVGRCWLLCVNLLQQNVFFYGRVDVGFAYLKASNSFNRKMQDGIMGRDVFELHLKPNWPDGAIYKVRSSPGRYG